MKINDLLKKIVYENKCYLTLIVFQMILVITFLSFIIYDFKIHIKFKFVKTIELIFAFLMILDLIFFTILDGKFNLFIFLEWIIVIFYLIIIFLVELNQLDEKDEILDLWIIFVRVFFQIFRLLMTFYVFFKVRKSNEVRKDFEIEMSQEIGDSNVKDADKEVDNEVGKNINV